MKENYNITELNTAVKPFVSSRSSTATPALR